MAIRVKQANRILLSLLILSLGAALVSALQWREARQFNAAVLEGRIPKDNEHAFEARYALAYWSAQAGRYQDAAQLLNQLMEEAAASLGAASRQAAVQYNLGNIFFTRGLMAHRNSGELSDEAQYLLNQARLAYEQALRLDNNLSAGSSMPSNTAMAARYNLDRVLRLLPDESKSPDTQDKMGIVMGNIPTGLP